MASLGNGNAWRGAGDESDPVARGDVSVEPGVSEGEPGIVQPRRWGRPVGIVYASHGPRHALCHGCYCTHHPACPPCECAFHNP